MWKRLRSLREVRRGFLGEWAVMIAVLLFGTTTLVQAFVIPSGSMESTFLVGDHVFVDKLVYSPADPVSGRLLPYRDVRRGDVIVFRHPLEPDKDLVKRAIGVPGDRIRLVAKQLHLNGKTVDEPYAVHIQTSADPYRDNFPSVAPTAPMRPRALAMLRDHVVNGELVVPPGYVFGMGDNRENSDDSRYFGLIPRENIRGTPVMIYWSYDATMEELMGPDSGVAHFVDVGLHFFTKTRWSRTMKLVRGYPLGR